MSADETKKMLRQARDAMSQGDWGYDETTDALDRIEKLEAENARLRLENRTMRQWLKDDWTREDTP